MLDLLDLGNEEDNQIKKLINSTKILSPIRMISQNFT